MNKELQDAMERYRNSDGFASCLDVSECIDALSDLAAAYVAEHPADEDEPVTIDWLNDLRRSDGGDLGMIKITLKEDRTMRLTGFGDHVSNRHATRGDVRRLFSALGIELKEKNHAN